ncbi:phosphatase PAP2 family protein [Glycomyces terrestris]|uniref:Phosphatase PAP2 family protein n=1 Tax=Glycomyces terrestris TaxID=2493553 RepID=A0A426USR0_9ACTN|nr:phosphatase PAP2 family protein [Glycomyces terrestris]RRR96564.1 phosphatase PAP2 family protein [Glycomyces terrestris]
MTVKRQRVDRTPAGGWTPFVAKRPGSWRLEIAMGLAFAVCTWLSAFESPLIDLDIWVRDFSDAHRPPWFETLLVYTNKLGQGGILSAVVLALAALLAFRRHTVRPMVAFLVMYGMAGLVLLLKLAFPRIYPHWPRPDPGPYADAGEALLFVPDRSELGNLGDSAVGAYPSGHVVNTFVWYGLLVLLVGALMTTWQRRLLLAAPVVIVFFSTTYLGFHWLTDSLAGVFIGVVIVRIMKRLPWATAPLPDWLEPERRYR